MSLRACSSWATQDLETDNWVPGTRVPLFIEIDRKILYAIFYITNVRRLS